MALTEAHLAATFNRPGNEMVDHRTWVLCSDGDLMEGVSAEAASLAGHLKLGKLVWIWDDNRITIEGDTELAISDDIPARFKAHGWRVLEVEDANDLGALADAFDAATASDGRPTLVRVRSHIAFGAPTKQDTAGAHGAPLGEDEVRATKVAYGWPEGESFLVPPEVVERGREVAGRGAETRMTWERAAEAWSGAEPILAAEWQRRLERRLPEGWSSSLPGFEKGSKIATRAASGKVLNGIAGVLPELVGGSADLAPSNKTLLASSGDLLADSVGCRNLHFGVREHAMGAILNGMALHGGVRPYGGTFLVFSDYMRPAIRLAALMEQPVVYVFTHDSVWVGEDGPTHQPVEHALALRAIPNLVVLRPADGNETAAAWKAALDRTSGPTALLLSRQGLPVFEGTCEKVSEGVVRGAYTLAEAPSGRPEIVLIATGGEVSLAVDASAELDEYRRQVLPGSIPRLAIEAGVTLGWRDVVGDTGDVIGIDRYGASAPGAEVAQRLGLKVDAVVARAEKLIEARK
jgi:transketolase